MKSKSFGISSPGRIRLLPLSWLYLWEAAAIFALMSTTCGSLYFRAPSVVMSITINRRCSTEEICVASDASSIAAANRPVLVVKNLITAHLLELHPRDFLSGSTGPFRERERRGWRQCRHCCAYATSCGSTAATWHLWVDPIAWVPEKSLYSCSRAPSVESNFPCRFAELTVRAASLADITSRPCSARRSSRSFSSICASCALSSACTWLNEKGANPPLVMFMLWLVTLLVPPPPLMLPPLVLFPALPPPLGLPTEGVPGRVVVGLAFLLDGFAALFASLSTGLLR